MRYDSSVNVLFFAFLLVSAAGAVVTWRRRQRANALLTREGPVPGYSFTPGAAISLAADIGLERGRDYRPVSIETFNSPNRSRIVLQFALADSVTLEAARAFAAACAADVASRSHARVVFVEIERGGRNSYYLWAPDGRGWTGGDPFREVFVAGVAS